MDAALSPATLSPLARYEQATAPDGWLTSSGWLALASDLDAEAGRLAAAGLNGTATKLRDRAADCRARAASMRAGAL